MASLAYLITGTGRCGTGWAAKVLTSAGLPCGHEEAVRLGDDGLRLARSGKRAEASWLAVGHFDHPLLADAKAIHLVREPLACIRSLASVLYGRDSAWSRYALDRLGRDDPDPLSRACKHYVRWNALVAEHADVRLRCEDGAAALLTECGRMGYQGAIDDPATNSRASGDYLEWDDLPRRWRGRVEHLAHRYGYEVPAWL